MRESLKDSCENKNEDNPTIRELAELNHSLDELYDLLYVHFNRITEKDYNKFGSQMSILLESINKLMLLTKKFSSNCKYQKETAKLGRNYSALAEIDSDIRELRIKLNKEEHENMSDLMSKASLSISVL